jgi:hypothetical protein
MRINPPGPTVAQPDGEIGVAHLGQSAIAILIDFDGFTEYLPVIEYKVRVARWRLEGVCRAIGQFFVDMLG